MTTISISPGATSTEACVSFHYNAALVELIKSLRQRSFDSETKAWTVDAAAVEDFATPAESAGHVVVRPAASAASAPPARRRQRRPRPRRHPDPPLPGGRARQRGRTDPRARHLGPRRLGGPAHRHRHRLEGARAGRRRRGRSGPRLTDDQYRTQTHLYGRGLHRTYGLRMRRVGLLRLPAAGERSEATWQCEPYDEATAVAGLLRAGRIAALVDALGGGAAGGGLAASVLPATEHHCTWCAYYDPKSDDLRRGCPGVGTLALPPRALSPEELFSKARTF